jgi:uncharacterized protein YbaP (TraB family)
MVDVLLAAAAIAAAAPQAPAQPPAEAAPAIFMVHDQDTTIYIFGTFHALDGRSEWLSRTVKTAFDSSDELVLETLIPEDHPVPAAPRPAFSMSAGTPVGTLSVAPTASFLATTRLAIDAGRSQGMQVGNGADMVLRRAAELAGKQLEGLETLDSQLTMFNHLPPAPIAAEPRVGAPVGNAVAMEALSSTMAELQSAWKRGDQSVFVRMLDQLRNSSPDTYRLMFAERNARWADWIAARMQTPGVVFVAVGAGHLAGKDSVLVRLAQLGVTSSRVN